MNLIARLLLLPALGAALGMGAGLARAGARGERPLQLQWDVFGISAGVHIDKQWFLGVTHRPRLRAHRLDANDFRSRAEIYDQRGVERFDLQLGQKDALELRYSPFEHGLYFALGLLRVKGDTQDVLFDNRARVVGDGAYVTELRVRVQGREQSAPAVGIGFNHVFPFGLSLGAGALFGLGHAETPRVQVEATNPAVLQSDLDKFKREVEDEFFDLPFLFHFAIGYNF
ncbi:MAG: hypothetical protein O6934_05365 [SAR324 cluster bacterium]|nr:hypothetical protein [SAR324 cluster bacterium]